MKKSFSELRSDYESKIKELEDRHENLKITHGEGLQGMQQALESKGQEIKDQETIIVWL